MLNTNVASAREWDFTLQMVWWFCAFVHLRGNIGLTIAIRANEFCEGIIVVAHNSSKLYPRPNFKVQTTSRHKICDFLNNNNFRIMLTETAKKQNSSLKQKVAVKFVDLKMDASTRIRVNDFAIKADYVGEGTKVKTNTLSVIDAQTNMRVTFCKQLVSDVLKNFEIEKQQVLCNVTDNALNMTSTTEKLNEKNEDRKLRRFC